MDIPENQKEIYEEAKKRLEDILELMELPSDVMLCEEFTVIDDDGEASSIGLNIIGDDLGILIGRRGQTINSLQHIVRLIVSSKIQSRIPIVIDVEGYKQRRCEGLRSLALRLADQVTVRKAPFTMEPMTAFERRIVHLALADHPDVFTESTGFGENRKVVISLKKINDSY